MDDPAPLAPPPRRSRVGPLAIIVALALVIGLALMWFAIRDDARWFGGAAPAAQPSAAAPQPAIAAPAAPVEGGGAATDPVTLATRESALAAQLAVLESRAATITAETAAAAGNAGRAEAILIAFAARRALDRGVGLGYLEEQLRARFGASQPQAALTVIQASRDPVTIEALRQALDANAALLMSAGHDGWLAGLGRELRSLVVLHDSTAPSPLPADRLARARRMLDAGQVEAALAEIDRLPGAAAAANWADAARRYVAARKALDTLEGAAILGPGPATPPVS